MTAVNECAGHAKHGLAFPVKLRQADRTRRMLGMVLCPRCESVAIEFRRSKGCPVIDVESPMQSGDLVHMYARRIEKCITGAQVRKVMVELAADARANATVAALLQVIAGRRIREMPAAAKREQYDEAG